jgi:hypothetical protein
MIMIILFLCASPIAIENITAQVQDVDISTAHIGLSSLFGNPGKALFIRPLPATITFFRQKNLMIWQIFYQITELLSKKSVSGIVVS